ncbi:MAG: NAD(P)/FAD-dependent oxidoreductase [Clostridia bacterium]|mgnify:CR=1 FL=1|jgi:glycerol-3-phosphate dehydrogenase
MIYDFVIIGAGVVGCMIARELSMYRAKICLLEKGNDVASGSSKANSGIVHAGYDAKPGTLKAKLNVLGCALMEKTVQELDVPYKKCGSIVAAFDQEGTDSIRKLYQRGLENGVSELFLLNREETMRLEPNIHPGVQGALYAKGAGIVCPYQLTIAAAENAVSNGAELRLNFKVEKIEKTEDLYLIKSAKDTVKARCVINAAGVFADKIAAMADDNSFTIIPRRGEYIILDKTEGKTVNTVIFQPPSEKGKGILVSPTADGNLLLGPTASVIEDKEDTSTTASGLDEVIKGAMAAVPNIRLNKTITSFSGIRATPDTGDFIIRESEKNPRFFHAAGIESPGLTAAPAIALYVIEMIKSKGILLEENPNSVRIRQGIPRIAELPLEEQNRWIQKNKAYGKIICRCESVTEGEIIDSIRRPAGATTVDGVKRRVRAGMGRCQGGFCMPKVLEILARELQCSPYEICKNEKGSYILKEGEIEHD